MYLRYVEEKLRNLTKLEITCSTEHRLLNLAYKISVMLTGTANM